MSLHQLVYLSQATHKMSTAELSNILSTAKRNNAGIDVTGSLFYNGGWFLQVLEGEKPTLDELYQKIEKDDRHKDSRVLYFETAPFRVFSRWTMNMTNLDEHKGEKYDKVVELIRAAKSSGGASGKSPATELLKLFSQH